MIGFYNYSVIATYFGLALSVAGMTLSFYGHFDYAILCLTLAGACDTFDGKIARSMKNRTEEMVIFGVQIDSLCDLVCFGVTPAVISFNIGLKSIWGIVIEFLFILCGVIRLAFFNMLEEKKHLNPNLKEEKKYYRGLPITTISVIYPIVFLLYEPLGQSVFTIIVAVMLAITAFLYILDFKLKKPGNAFITVLIVFVFIVMLKNLNFFGIFS